MKLICSAIKSILLLFLTQTLTVMAQEETIRVETNIVNVGITVKDKKGNYLTGLKKEQFELFDNGEKQEIALFSDENTSVSFGIIYDLHPTNSENTKTIIESLVKFSKDLPAQDDIFTLVFNERGSLMLDFVPTIDQIDKFLSTDKSVKSNSLYDAIYTASQKINSRPNQKKSLIIISDGKDDFSHHSYSELSRHLKSLNVQIYSVIFDRGENWQYSNITLQRQRVEFGATELDRAKLAELAGHSGGSAKTSVSPNLYVLEQIFREIGNDIRRQYSIGFYPSEIDGKWHKLKLKIRSEGKKLELNYRDGYQSVLTRP